LPAIAGPPTSTSRHQGGHRSPYGRPHPCGAPVAPRPGSPPPGSIGDASSDVSVPKQEKCAKSGVYRACSFNFGRMLFSMGWEMEGLGKESTPAAVSDTSFYSCNTSMCVRAPRPPNSHSCLLLLLPSPARHVCAALLNV